MIYSPSSLPTKAMAETTEETTAITTANIMINKPPPSNKNAPDIIITSLLINSSNISFSLGYFFESVKET